MLCLTSLYCGPPQFIWHYLKSTPRHRCRVLSDDPSVTNVTEFLYPDLDKYIPKKNFWSREVSPCKKYDSTHPFTLLTNSAVALLSCDDNYVFDTDDANYVYTPAVEFGLVCDKGWMWDLAPVVFTVGTLAGAVLTGLLADKLGRRPALFFSLIVMTLGGVLEIIVPDPKAYLALVGMTAVGIMGTFQTAFVLAMELVGSSQRRPVGFTYYLFFHCGYFISTFYAYYIRDWRLQKVALLVPGVIFIIYWWILPESAQWLLTKGRTKEAEDMLSKAAQVNKGHDAGSIVFENKNSDDVLMREREVRTEGCSEVFGSSQPRNSFIVIFVIMLLVGAGPVASRMYFVLYDDVYWEYLLNGGLEMGGCLVGILFSPFFNRRQLFLVCSLVVSCSFLLMAILTIYDEWELFWIRIILWKVFISTAVCNLRVLAAELFPTRARGTCLSLCSVLMGVGEFINIGVTPIIEMKRGSQLSHKDKEPFVFYGFMAAAAGLLILLLPEMYNKPMPHTFTDCKDFNTYNSDFGGLIKMMQKIQGAKQNQRVQEIMEEKRRESQAALRSRQRGNRASRYSRAMQHPLKRPGSASTGSIAAGAKGGTGTRTPSRASSAGSGINRSGGNTRKNSRESVRGGGVATIANGGVTGVAAGNSGISGGDRGASVNHVNKITSPSDSEVKVGLCSSRRTSVDTELDLMGFYAYGEKLLASHFSLPAVASEELTTPSRPTAEPKTPKTPTGATPTASKSVMTSMDDGEVVEQAAAAVVPTKAASSTSDGAATAAGSSGSSNGAKRKQHQQQHSSRDLGTKLAESRVSSKKKRHDSGSAFTDDTHVSMRDQQTQAMEIISLASLNESDL